MKHTAGYAKPRRMTPDPRPARLNLQRRPKPGPEDDLDERHKGQFWKWVILIAVLHVLVILACCVFYLFAPAPKPPDPFITLLPPGDTVKGSPGAQQAHKLGANTPAAPHHAAPPPAAHSHTAPARPKTATPPTPPSKPVVKENAPSPAPAPTKPVKPAKPKVKVDLREVERADEADAPPKPSKHHSKKPVKNPDDSQDDVDSSPDNTGLSRQQIAEKLGDKLNASGSHNATKYGPNGSPSGRANEFQDYYNMIANQVSDEWNSPITGGDRQPVVSMHVEPDGRIDTDSVHLISSSGDPAYDDAAIDTVKRMGHLHEPLPNGCPPDITISIKPNPQQ